MKIFNQNQQKMTKRNRSYDAEFFVVFWGKITLLEPDGCLGRGLKD